MLRVVTFGLCALFSASTVSAGPITYGFVQLPGYSCGPCGGTPSVEYDTSGTTSSTGSVTGQSPQGFVNTQGTASSTADLSTGILRAAATLSDDPGSTISRSGIAQANAGFDDMLTFTYSGDLTDTWSVSMSVTLSGEIINDGQMNFQTLFSSPDVLMPNMSYYVSTGGTFDGPQTLTSTFTATDTSSVTLSFISLLHAGVFLGTEHTSASLFGNSAHFSLDLDPNVTFTSASGAFLSSASNPTPVPEPASLALLGMGLVTMGGRAWHRRRASR